MTKFSKPTDSKGCQSKKFQAEKIEKSNLVNNI